MNSLRILLALLAVSIWSLFSAGVSAQDIPSTAEVDWLTLAPETFQSQVTVTEGRDTPFAVIAPAGLFKLETIAGTASDPTVIPAGALLASGRVSRGKMLGNKVFCEIDRQKGHEYNQCLMVAQGASGPTHVFRSYNPGGAYFFGLNRPNPIPLLRSVELTPIKAGDAQKLRLVLKLERVKSHSTIFQFDLCYADYTYSFLLNHKAPELACTGPRFELNAVHPVFGTLGGTIELVRSSEKSAELRIKFPPAGMPFALHGVGL